MDQQQQHVDELVLQYLSKKGYTQAEQALRRDTQLQTVEQFALSKELDSYTITFRNT